MTQSLRAPLEVPSPWATWPETSLSPQDYRLKVLGHPHLTRQGQVVQLPHKALALLTYLSLEKNPAHREQLADLLWDSNDALRNLRVELNKLKQLGLHFFPARQAMLSVQLPLDFDDWKAQAHAIHEDNLEAWLSQLRQLPLSGLEDLGTAGFQQWVEQQRTRLLDEVEAELLVVQRRLREAGAHEAAQRVQERAAQLGLELPHQPVPIQEARRPFASYLHQERLQLHQVMTAALRSPQLVILQGQTGLAAEFIGPFAELPHWQVIQLHFSGNRLSLQQALLFQLFALLPPSEKITFQDVMRQLPAHEEVDVVRLGQMLTALGKPLMIVLHQISELPAWFKHSIQFLMQLPIPLVMIGVPGLFRDHTGDLLPQLDWNRVHYLTLPSLSTRQIQDQVAQSCPELTDDEQFSLAARLNQITEGWLPYALFALKSQVTLRSVRPEWRIPNDLGLMLRTSKGHLSAQARAGLTKLAQLHHRFTPELVRSYLGELAEPALYEGLSTGLLVQASAQEQVDYPTWSCHTADHEECLAFNSELNRVALAGGLAPLERQAARRQLAGLLQDSDPVLSAYYLQRSQQCVRPVLASTAVSSPRWEPLSRPLRLPEHPERHLRTPNGYRLTRSVGTLDVQRRGWPSQPPLLLVQGLTLPAGPWSLWLRQEVRSRPDLLSESSFGLAYRLGEAAWQVYGPEELHLEQLAGQDAHFAGVVPLQRWVKLSGHSPRTQNLQLAFQSVDLALTITAFEAAGRAVLF